MMLLTSRLGTCDGGASRALTVQPHEHLRAQGVLFRDLGHVLVLERQHVAEGQDPAPRQRLLVRVHGLVAVLLHRKGLRHGRADQRRGQVQRQGAVACLGLELQLLDQRR